MPQRLFYLDEKKQYYLSASWKHNWSNFRLRFQDEVICSFATKKELAAGRQFVMPNGRLLSVRLKGTVQPELEIMRDGLPLPDNSNESRRRQKTLFHLAFFLGIINITGGIVAAVTQSDIMLSIGFGYGSAAVGAVYLSLAWGIRRMPSYAAFAIIAFIALDMALLFVFTAMREGPTSPVSGLLVKLFLIYAFLKGVEAMNRIRAQAAATTA